MHPLHPWIHQQFKASCNHFVSTITLFCIPALMRSHTHLGNRLRSRSLSIGYRQKPVTVFIGGSQRYLIDGSGVVLSLFWEFFHGITYKIYRSPVRNRSHTNCPDQICKCLTGLPDFRTRKVHLAGSEECMELFVLQIFKMLNRVLGVPPGVPEQDQRQDQ